MDLSLRPRRVRPNLHARRDGDVNGGYQRLYIGLQRRPRVLDEASIAEDARPAADQALKGRTAIPNDANMDALAGLGAAQPNNR